jgi:hypothetical protein
MYELPKRISCLRYSSSRTQQDEEGKAEVDEPRIEEGKTGTEGGKEEGEN